MKKDIVFTLPAEALEGATEAVLLGDFNNWTPGKEFELESHQDGSFRTVISLEEGATYHYRFLLNNGRWVNDYNAQQYTPIAGLYIDNCVITVSESNNQESQKSEPEHKKPAVKAKATKAMAPKAEETKAKKAAATKITKAAKATPADEKAKVKKVEKPVKAERKKLQKW
jgi:hypothetical protein